MIDKRNRQLLLTVILTRNGIFFLVLILSLVLISCSKKSESDHHPNVILIMSDDQGWGDSEFNGNTFIETPNLNRLVVDGVQFERMYACPMCAPTRASLMTGPAAPARILLKSACYS
ncbi:sulfatase-like hydrolase/transferase [Maribellus comscasis]